MKTLNLTKGSTENVLHLIDKMRYLLCIVFCSLHLLSGCQKVDDVKKPDKLLSKAEMKNLIYDMVLLDAASGVGERKLQSLDLNMYEFLTNKYGLDSTLLHQNIDYYNINFDDNLDIYKQVKDSIQNLERVYDSVANRIDSLNQIQQKKEKDSLKTLDSIQSIPLKKQN